MPCVEHLARLRERQPELDTLGVRVFVVAFESAASVRRYRARHDIPWPVLRDPRRDAYRAFGMERNPVRALVSPKTIWHYLRQAMRGRLPRLTASDYAQLGGDVLLSATGERCWVHVSREPADRASIDQIVRAARACAAD
ncbi:MAG TPA: peroxiredoxin-like family protein [Thermomicrobiales bacterium]|nr:peroxiredoxin-like family protein [Thermomicrobiales bacterium]